MNSAALFRVLNVGKGKVLKRCCDLVGPWIVSGLASKLIEAF